MFRRKTDDGWGPPVLEIPQWMFDADARSTQSDLRASANARLRPCRINNLAALCRDSKTTVAERSYCKVFFHSQTNGVGARNFRIMAFCSELFGRNHSRKSISSAPFYAAVQH